MANYKTGDFIRIDDVQRIMYGNYYWRNGDVVEVLDADGFGEGWLRVHAPHNCDEEGYKPGTCKGKPVMSISPDEFGAISKAEKPETPQDREHFFDVYIVQVRANVRAANPAEAERKVREGLSPLAMMQSRVTAYHVDDVNQRWEGGKP